MRQKVNPHTGAWLWGKTEDGARYELRDGALTRVSSPKLAAIEGGPS